MAVGRGRVARDLIRTGHAPPQAGSTTSSALYASEDAAGGRPRSGGALAVPGKPYGQPAGFWAQTIPPQGGALFGDRIFCTTTERPGTDTVSPALDRLAARVNAAGNLTSQAGTGAWNSTLLEIAVLGCHANNDAGALALGKPDDAEALALAVHQLRQAPDYAAALSLPLPLHLAGLAQAYVLPMLVESDENSAGVTAGPTVEQEQGARRTTIRTRTSWTRRG